jgi:polysaccharide pyruvyl transferase WcaK-like protein
MQILLDQAVYDQRNKGNVSLLQSAIYRLNELWPDAEIFVLTEAPHLLKLYCPTVQPVSVHFWQSYLEQRKKFDTFHHLVPGPVLQLLLDAREEMWHRFPELMGKGWRQRVKSLLGSKNSLPELGVKPSLEGSVSVGEDPDDVNQDLLRTVQEVDLVIATGGGYLCDTDKQHTIQVFDTLEMAVRMGKPTAMVGQGVGPMHDPELRSRLSKLLPSLDLILIREPKTGRDLMESLGVSSERVMMSGDDAIQMAYKERTEKLGEYVGVNLRFARYTEVGQSYISKIRTVLHQAARKHSAPLMALPISCNVHEGDLEVIRDLLQGYENVSISWRRFESPLTTIRKVGRCRLVVTGAYHPAVYALSQGIPVVGLVKSQAYIDKFSALVDEFGPACQLIYLDDEQIEEKLAVAIDTAWVSANEVRPLLLQAAVRQIEWGRTAYQHLHDLVMEKR